MLSPIAALSASIAGLVANAAAALAAIRTGPNRHVTGLLCRDDIIVSTDQALPLQDHYTVVLPTGELAAARPGPRDRSVAVLQLDAPVGWKPLAFASATLGGLVVVLGADAQARPTVRLTLIHRLVRLGDIDTAVLDLTADQVAPGSAVLDADGRLIGLLALGPEEQANVVPAAAITQLVAPNRGVGKQTIGRRSAGVPPTPPIADRGWLGVSLQPITMPEALVSRAGQASGRMVVDIAAGGPADRSGLRIGDVLLTLNDVSVSGPNVLRAFLGPARIGSLVDIRMLRDGSLIKLRLVVAARPE